MSSMKFDQLTVTIDVSMQEMGARAANDLAAVLNAELASRGEAALIVATGNSQLSFMQALRARTDVAWDRISIFHMDEYLGMSESHTASFRRYVREKLVDHVHPRAFYGLQGDAADAQAEIARYAALLREHRPVAVVMGIGENGHLAFNDPPADFETRELVHIVQLDEACRLQQVGEGHFADLGATPTHALSLTIHALLQPQRLFVVVPESRKARAVHDALRGPVTPLCPASILRTCAHAHLYLDAEAAAEVDRDS
jgi:glucosamine-6-phosphate deaminase